MAMNIIDDVIYPKFDQRVNRAKNLTKLFCDFILYLLTTVKIITIRILTNLYKYY